MKSQIKKDLKTRTLAELKTALSDAKKELFNLRLDLDGKKLKNTRSIYTKRKDIAVIQTFMNEKETYESA